MSIAATSIKKMTEQHKILIRPAALQVPGVGFDELEDVIEGAATNAILRDTSQAIIDATPERENENTLSNASR
jgi:hypothetical protein